MEPGTLTVWKVAANAYELMASDSTPMNAERRLYCKRNRDVTRTSFIASYNSGVYSMQLGSAMLIRGFMYFGGA
jgi:hypothetical protein